MGISATGASGGGLFVLAVASLLLAMPAESEAQLFNIDPLRPPADIPSGALGPAQSLAPPSAPPAAPKGPMLQSLPPAAAPASLPPHPQAAPAIPSGQVALAVTARFGRDLPAINGGLHWRIYPSKPETSGAFRLIKEEKTAAPIFTLPAGSYVIHVGFGLASATKAVDLRPGEPVRELFEIPAGGLRIEGKVGDARIPPGQISFDLFRGSQFEPGDKRPIVQSVQTGDVILLPEGTYHIVSNYGDANATVRSDIRVQTAKLTDATVTHRAAVITLKLVNQSGGEARANTQWSVLTPGGDVVKESIGAFPRVILAEGDYRAIARNDDKTFERAFKVITGVDGEVEVLAR
jgi:hypothetical protein